MLEIHKNIAGNRVFLIHDSVRTNSIYLIKIVHKWNNARCSSACQAARAAATSAAAAGPHLICYRAAALLKHFQVVYPESETAPLSLIRQEQFSQRSKFNPPLHLSPPEHCHCKADDVEVDSEGIIDNEGDEKTEDLELLFVLLLVIVKFRCR